MTTVNHEQVFLEFVKHHDVLQHLTYSDSKIENQKIIGLLETVENDDIFIPFFNNLVQEGDVLINPNYDELYNSFLKIDYNLESVQYIKTRVENIQTKEQLIDFLVSVIIKPLIASNINAKNVYFRITPSFTTDWCDQVIEVK